jgi:hypothetical protein
MRTINFNQVTSSLWEYNISLDSDALVCFYLEEREEGEAQFELDRAEILTSTLHFMKGRVDPLFTPKLDVDA